MKKKNLIVITAGVTALSIMMTGCGTTSQPKTDNPTTKEKKVSIADITEETTGISEENTETKENESITEEITGESSENTDEGSSDTKETSDTTEETNANQQSTGQSANNTEAATQKASAATQAAENTQTKAPVIPNQPSTQKTTQKSTQNTTQAAKPAQKATQPQTQAPKPTAPTTAPTQPQTTAHEHNWQAHYATRTVKEAWDEPVYCEYDVTEMHFIHTCNGNHKNGCDLTEARNRYLADHPGSSWNEFYCNQIGYIEPCGKNFITGADDYPGANYLTQPVVVGKDKIQTGTIRHEAETEQYVDYYTCACGATK